MGHICARREERGAGVWAEGGAGWGIWGKYGGPWVWCESWSHRERKAGSERAGGGLRLSPEGAGKPLGDSEHVIKVTLLLFWKRQNKTNHELDEEWTVGVPKQTQVQWWLDGTASSPVVRDGPVRMRWSHSLQVSIRREKTSSQRGCQALFFPKGTPWVKVPLNEMTKILHWGLLLFPERGYLSVESRRADGLDTYVPGY